MISIFQNNNLEEIYVNGILFYKSIFKYLDSNMYITIKNNEALIIDPNPNDNAISLLKDSAVTQVKIFLTHEHRDHVYGIYCFKEHFKTDVISTKLCAEYISNINNSRPTLMTFLIEEYDRQNNTNYTESFKKEYIPRTYNPDITFEEGLTLKWFNHTLTLFKIQGHSKGSCGIIFDKDIIFSGDSLLKNIPIITRFPGGNTNVYKKVTLPLLEKKLHSNFKVMPGHGEPFQLKEIIKNGKLNVEIR